MTIRYFVPDLPRGGGQLELPENEAHHAATVMRIQPGQAVVLFDGQGYQSDACIESVAKRRVHCQAVEAVWLPRENARQVCLAIAMPKGDRARDLIERLTELGVDRVVPVHCQRSPWSVSAAAVQKWQRVVIEACKQCGRNRLMRIEPACDLSEFLSREAGQDELRWFAHPGGTAVPAAVGGPTMPATPATPAKPASPAKPAGEAPASPGDAAAGDSRPSVRVAIGPEGGFTQQEAAAAQQLGWTAVGLGERIYRIETAAIILAIKAAVI